MLDEDAPVFSVDIACGRRLAQSSSLTVSCSSRSRCLLESEGPICPGVLSDLREMVTSMLSGSLDRLRLRLCKGVSRHQTPPSLKYKRRTREEFSGSDWLVSIAEGGLGPFFGQMCSRASNFVAGGLGHALYVEAVACKLSGSGAALVNWPSGHKSPCHGEMVKTADGLPAKVGMTCLSCGVLVVKMDSASGHGGPCHEEVKTGWSTSEGGHDSQVMRAAK
ncbi:hypothetical protein CRG98_011361 [Punica granatum]|uniref:Uncharacterized protein n=1 Tax=Punica granatum TaxID=22663 RepID=A0A2I0KI77_PUNGR|nr:hypothetical protein CRG98_011361 [Punica granatum]